METSKTKGALLLLTVFLLGMICGGAGMVIGLRAMRQGPRPMQGPPGMPPMARFDERLDLDAGQQEQVREILDRSRTRVVEAMHESREEIRKVLREDQLEEFERMGPGAFDRYRRSRGRGRRFGQRP